MKKFLYESRFFIYGAISGAILITILAIIGITIPSILFILIYIISGIIITPFIPKLDEKLINKYFKGVR